MKFAKKWYVVLLVVSVISLVYGNCSQKQFGLKKEQTPVLWEWKYIVNAFEGIVWRDVCYSKSRLSDVKIEIFSNGESEKISETKSDPEGVFGIIDIQPGKYKFIAKLKGYQTLVGNVIVDNDADITNKIVFPMVPVGMEFREIIYNCSSYSERNTWEYGGMLRGFRNARYSSKLVELEDPLTVKAVKGFVIHNGNKVPGVIFEMRGPNKQDKIWETKTDKNGYFEISSIIEGLYIFKTTYDGFQSTCGKIIVKKEFGEKEFIEISIDVD